MNPVMSPLEALVAMVLGLALGVVLAPLGWTLIRKIQWGASYRFPWPDPRAEDKPAA